MITPQKEQQLGNRLQDLKINKNDVIEKFIRSGGAGGQNVNKVATCVYLKHLPTGLEVKMQRQRSRELNRFLAWRLLADKIEERLKGIESTKQQAIEKKRRQKRKRSKRAKEKILGYKKKQAEKKKLRQTPPEDFS